jgi:YebC/PmpR family DNA-binding regulatory protein
MGRAFEYRKATKMKRWAGMAKNFTKVGREIAIAIKEGGADPAYNSRLRLAMQNAKSFNMPKVNVENAIKRATSKDAENFAEVVYEGYAPNGIAVLVETTTDNPTRTVANVRSYFNKCHGSLGTSGSVEYMFDRKGVFKVKSDGLVLDDLEMELIDAGLDEIKTDEEGDLLIYCEFSEFGNMQKALEERKIDVLNAELVRIPNIQKQLSDEQVEQVIKLIDKLEEDEDVANVFHTMDMSE